MGNPRGFGERMCAITKAALEPPLLMETDHNHGKRVCIFVDGENMRHSIVELFPSPVFHEWDYLPKDADWTRFFDWIACEAAGKDAHRVRTYWYVVENLDYNPYNLNQARKDRILLKQVLERHGPWASDLALDKTEEERQRRMDKMLTALQDNLGKMKGRFEGWNYIQNKIASDFTAVEFRRAGSIRYNLFDKRLGKEKAVDVKLAVDLVGLEDIYDVAVIVSGDQDYVPAVETIKDFGKRVVNISFLKEDGYVLPGGAMRLNYATDKGLQIPHTELRAHLNL